jgi:hypothetical protein
MKTVKTYHFRKFLELSAAQSLTTIYNFVAIPGHYFVLRVNKTFMVLTFGVCLIITGG